MTHIPTAKEQAAFDAAILAKLPRKFTAREAREALGWSPTYTGHVLCLLVASKALRRVRIGHYRRVEK